MILMLVGLMGATGGCGWSKPQSDPGLTSCKAPLIACSDLSIPSVRCQGSQGTFSWLKLHRWETQDVGRLKAIGVFDRKPRIGTARRNRPGRNGVWQNWESASWVSTFASRIKKLSELWGKVYLSLFDPRVFFLHTLMMSWMRWWDVGPQRHLERGQVWSGPTKTGSTVVAQMV